MNNAVGTYSWSLSALPVCVCVCVCVCVMQIILRTFSFNSPVENESHCDFVKLREMILR